MKAKFYKLKKELRYYHTDGSTSIWDPGELVLFRKAEPKRHGDGVYPDRIISCTDGSMIAMNVVEILEQNMGEKYLEAIT